MHKDKDIFDQKLVSMRRGRGQNMSSDAFLHARCADDATERILDINRSFSNTLILASPDISDRIINSVGHKLGMVTRVNYSTHIHGSDIICEGSALPFIDESFELVIDALNLHTVNHIPRALAGLKRVLVPDGLFIASLFGGQTLSALRRALYEAEESIYGHITPRVSPMITAENAIQLLQGTGFAMPVVDKDTAHVHYTQLSSLYVDIRRMGDSNALISRCKKPVSKRFFKALEHIYARDNMNAGGKLTAIFEIIWLTGWAAHKDQPKPLKPGSATTSLATVLGVKEQKL